MRLLCGIALASVACSTTPAISVVATPSPLFGDGVTTATVTATVTEGGTPVDGAVVHFKLTVQGGVPGAPTYAAWVGAAAGTPTLIDATTQGGTASATMTSPRQGFGTVLFTVSYSSQGKEPSASVTIPLKPAGALPAGSLSFVCDHQNIGALVQGRITTIHTLCRATAIDTANHVIQGASIQTLSEAGSLDWQIDDTSGTSIFLYSVRPDDPHPKDVGPLGADGKEQDICPGSCNADPFASACQGEPCWVDPTGVTHNPRDGVVTLIAAVPGGSDWDNYGEPFIDKNDNGTRDPDEPFIDYDGNGKWDGPSGTQRPHMVWKPFRIIWSGEAQVSATGTGTTHDCWIDADPGTPGGIVYNLFDRNLNAVAADGIASSDGISWTSHCSGDGSIAFGVDDQVMDQIHPGILFNSDTGAISVPGTRSTYTRNIDYHNSAAFTGTTGQSCTLTAAPHRQYDPGAPGFDSQVETTNPDAALSTVFSY